MRYNLLLSLIVVILSSTLVASKNDLFDCEYGTGTYYDDATMYDQDNLQKWSHLAISVGYNKSFDKQLIKRAIETADDWDIPLLLNAPIIAYAAEADEGIKECHSSLQGSNTQDDASNTKTLCSHGSEYIRTHRDEIISIYKTIAEGILANSKYDDIYWLIEPNYYLYNNNNNQYITSNQGNIFIKQYNNGLSNQYMASLYHDICQTIKKSLPKNKVGLNISSHIYLNAPIYYQSFNKDDVDFLYTSGNMVSPTTMTLGPRHTWSVTWWECAYGYFGPKPILGHCSGESCYSWLTSQAAQSLRNLNVLSVTVVSDDTKQRNELAVQGNQYCKIKYTLSEPPLIPLVATCPIQVESEESSKHAFGQCGFNYGYTWDWNFNSLYETVTEESDDNDNNNGNDDDNGNGNDSNSNNLYNHPFTLIRTSINTKQPSYIYDRMMAYTRHNNQGATLVIYGNTGEQYNIIKNQGNVDTNTSTPTTKPLNPCNQKYISLPGTWCRDGGQYMMNNSDGILSYTKDWAGFFKTRYSPEQRAIWVVEPRMAYMSEQTQPEGGLTSSQIGKIWSDAYFAFKFHFPNGILALAINPRWTVKQLESFVSQIPSRQIGIIYIAHEDISPHSGKIAVSSENDSLTWQQLKDAIERPIIIESNDPIWYTPEIYKSRYTDNVVGVISNQGYHNLIQLGNASKGNRCTYTTQQQTTETSAITIMKQLLPKDTTDLECLSNYNCIGYTNKPYDTRDKCLMGGRYPITTPNNQDDDDDDSDNSDNTDAENNDKDHGDNTTTNEFSITKNIIKTTDGNTEQYDKNSSHSFYVFFFILLPILLAVVAL